MKNEILESLQCNSIWIVPASLKDEYERLLISYSSNKAILFQSVTTFSLFYQELLKSKHLFSMHKIARMDKIKVLIEMIVQQKYQYISIKNMNQVIEMIDTMIANQVTMPDLSKVPYFTQKKLEECYDLYTRYLAYLKENHYYDGNYEGSFSYHKKIYIPKCYHLSKVERNFISQFDVCYVDLEEGSHIVKECNYTTSKVEVDAILHDIVVKVNQEHNSLHDYIIYAPSSYKELIQMEAKKYAIPLNGSENVSDKTYSILKLIRKYIIEKDISTLVLLMNFVNKKEMVWDSDKGVKTGVYDHIYLGEKLNPLLAINTMQEASKLLVKIMIQLGDDPEMLAYIASYDLEIEIDILDYINLVINLYPPLVAKYQSLNYLDIANVHTILPGRKYTYIAGCNEESFPNVSKDTGLLLNEDKEVFGIPTLIDDIEEEKKMIDLLIHSSNYLELSYNNGSLDGKDALKSTYLEALEKKYQIEKMRHQDRYITSLLAEGEGLVGTHHPYVARVEALADEYQTSQNQPLPVKTKQKKDLSISMIERYNGCPFKYFMTYDLHIQPWKDKNLQVNEYGSLRHDIVEKCSDYINGEDLDIDSIIHDMCEEMKVKAADSVAQSYYLDQIEKQMNITVRVLRYQNLTGEFKISGHEVPVEKDQGNYQLHGRFDRKDLFEDYTRIIDYKSSNKELDVELARMGFNIQMLLYLDMLEEKQAGVLYFNMANRILRNAKFHEIDKKDFYKQFKMTGLLVDNEASLVAMGIDNGENILPVKRTKSGELRGSYISEEDLQQLFLDIYTRIDEIVKEKFDEGNIRIDPAYGNDDKINHIVDPCTYCDYANVCLKDVFYNQGREIKIKEAGEEDEVE